MAYAHRKVGKRGRFNWLCLAGCVQEKLQMGYDQCMDNKNRKNSLGANVSCNAAVHTEPLKNF